MIFCAGNVFVSARLTDMQPAFPQPCLHLACFGPLLGSPGAILGRFGVVLELLGAVLKRFRGLVGEEGHRRELMGLG